MRLAHSILAAVCLGAAACPAWASDDPPVMAHAKQCLRDNADRIVAADPDLVSAASFLLTYSCAAEVEAAARYERNSSFASLYNSMSAFSSATTGKAATVSKASETVDPDTGEIVLHPPPSGTRDRASAVMSQLGAEPVGQFTPQAAPFALRKLAGDLVLEARERRMAAKAP